MAVRTPSMETMPREELKKLQSERLVWQVKRMYDSVECFRKRMDEKGLTQWNKANYHQKYPLSYYESECEKGRIFVLEDIASKEIWGYIFLLIDF